jgi:arylsulfatase A-like enzyme
LKAPPHAKELDLASIQFLDRRSRLGSTSHGSIREAIGRNAEQCIFAYCPSMISWTVNLGSDPSLEGRWGFLGDGPVKMLLTLSDSDGEHELIRSTLNNESDCESLSAGLERWAGKEVKITWQAEGPRRTVALWGSPIIWSGGRGHQPNVVIYLIDALRADRLGRYGNPHKLTPNADSMAAQGTVFTRAYAAANWTHPSVPSLLMGVMPDVHGASITGYKVRGDIPTLAEIFAAHGYATASYSANGYAGTFTNLDRGFDRARCLLYAYSDELVNDDLGGWIGQHSGVPFFLYVHAMDPHAPYAPEDADLRIFDPSVGGEPCNWDALYDPEGLEGKVTVEGRRARYDAEVVDADRGLGRLLAWLDELEISDNTIVVFVADHGEYLGEKGEWAHGGPRMGIELLHVPMIWRWPNGRFLTGTVEAPVSLLDVLPTLLAAAGTDGAALDYLQGVNLLPTLKTGDETPLAGRTIWSMASPVLKSAIRGNRQFISNGERFVQDSQSGEWRAVAPSEEDVARQFESWPASQLPPPSAAATGHVEIGHDLVEALRALGYVR